MVLSPNGSTFLVDVKGQSTKNFWRIKAKQPMETLYYVLCYVPPYRPDNMFFPMSQSILLDLMTRYQFSGVKYDERFSGFNWGAALPHLGKWSALPIDSSL